MNPAHGCASVGPARVGGRSTRQDRAQGRSRAREPWNAELRELGYRDFVVQSPSRGPSPAWIDRDAVADLVVSILGAKKSAWNAADLRGQIETLLAQTCLIADTSVRSSLPRTSPLARRLAPCG